MSTREERPLRRDALENRERVLAAAVAAVLRDGPQVPMATIAAEAGVGVGTLYRRYPNREALLDALTHRSFELLAGIAKEAETRPGPAIQGLSWWWDRVIDERDQLVLPLSGGPPVLSPATVKMQSQLHQSLSRLLRRGQRQHNIREDVTTRDLILFGAMLVSLLPGAKDSNRDAGRQKRIYVDGLATRSSPAG